MEKIVKECIAGGTVLREKDEEGKVVKEIAATVYEEKIMNDESASSSAAEGKKSVVLRYKNFAYAEDITAPLGFDEIAGDAALVVPGINGHEDVELDAPVVVKYSKTKSFERDGNTVVMASLRYDM